MELENKVQDSRKASYGKSGSIFIGEKIYQKIEKCETWEDVLLTIRKGLNLLKRFHKS